MPVTPELMKNILVIIASVFASIWSLAFPIALIGVINGYAKGKLLDELYLLILLGFFGTIMEGLTRLCRNALVYEVERSAYTASIKDFFNGVSKRTFNLGAGSTVGEFLYEQDAAEARLSAENAQQKVALYDIFFIIFTVFLVYLVSEELGKTLILATSGILIFGLIFKISLVLLQSNFKQEKIRLNNFLIRSFQTSEGADAASSLITKRQFERLLKKLVINKTKLTQRHKLALDLKHFVVGVLLIYLVGEAAKSVVTGELSIGVFSGFVIMGIRTLNTASAFLGAIYVSDFGKFNVNLRQKGAVSGLRDSVALAPTSLSVCGQNIEMQSSHLTMQGMTEDAFHRLLEIASYSEDSVKDVICMSGVQITKLDAQMITTASAFNQNRTVLDVVTGSGTLDTKRAEILLRESSLFEKFINLADGFKTSVYSASMQLNDDSLEYKLQMIAFLQKRSRILLLDIHENSPVFRRLASFLDRIGHLTEKKVIVYKKQLSVMDQASTGVSLTSGEPLRFNNTVCRDDVSKLSGIKRGLRNLLPKNVSGRGVMNGDIHTLALFLHDLNLIQNRHHFEASFPYLPDRFNSDVVEEFLFNDRIAYRRGNTKVDMNSRINTPAILTQKNGQLVYFNRDKTGRLRYAKNGLNLLPMTRHTNFMGDIISLENENREREHNPLKKLQMRLFQSFYFSSILVTLEQMLKIAGLLYVTFLYIYVFPARDASLVDNGMLLFGLLLTVGFILGHEIRKRFGVYKTQVPYYAGILAFEAAFYESRASYVPNKIDFGLLKYVHNAIDADQKNVRELLAARASLPFYFLGVALITVMDLVTGMLIMSIVTFVNVVGYVRKVVDRPDLKITSSENITANYIGNTMVSRRAQRYMDISKGLYTEAMNALSNNVNAVAYKFYLFNFQTISLNVLTTGISLISFASILSSEYSTAKLGYFFFMVILISQTVPYLMRLGDIFRSTQVSNDYIDGIGEIEHAPWSHIEASMFKEKHMINKVSLDKATYRSASHTDPTLLGVTLDFEAGKINYIYNPDREHWKQSVKILSGSTELQVGRLLINDLDASTYFTKVNLSNVITFNFSVLFPRDTIKNIVTQRNNDIDEQRLSQITMQLGLNEFIHGLPGGLNHRLMDFEDELYDRDLMQKLDLARTLYSQADFKVLQDPSLILQPRQWVWVYRELAAQAQSGKVIIIIGNSRNAQKLFPNVTKISKGLVS